MAIIQRSLPRNYYGNSTKVKKGMSRFTKMVLLSLAIFLVMFIGLSHIMKRGHLYTSPNYPSYMIIAFFLLGICWGLMVIYVYLTQEKAKIGIFKRRDTDSEQLLEVHAGDQMELVEKFEEWSKVKNEKVIGYIQNKNALFPGEGKAQPAKDESAQTDEVPCLTVQVEKKLKIWRYVVLGLFILSVVFCVGGSFSYLMQAVASHTEDNANYMVFDEGVSLSDECRRLFPANTTDHITTPYYSYFYSDMKGYHHLEVSFIEVVDEAYYETEKNRVLDQMEGAEETTLSDLSYPALVKTAQDGSQLIALFRDDNYTVGMICMRELE